MELITRKRAIRDGLVRYYTGEPCKSGHTSERYTSTAGCIECLRPNLTIAAKIPRANERSRKLQLISDMVRARFVLHEQNVEAFRFMQLTLSQSRDASVTSVDLLTGVLPRAHGPMQRLHTYRVFPEHVETLHEYERSLAAAR